MNKRLQMRPSGSPCPLSCWWQYQVSGAEVRMAVDWPSSWPTGPGLECLPDRWESGAFMGNGLLGANLYTLDEARSGLAHRQIRRRLHGQPHPHWRPGAQDSGRLTAGDLRWALGPEVTGRSGLTGDDRCPYLHHTISSFRSSS